MSGPSVRIVSYADSGGGAFLAAYRQHRAVLGVGIESRMRVVVKRTDDPTVEGPRGGVARISARIRNSLACRAARALGPGDGAYRTLALFPTGLRRELDSSPEDLLHLHWVGGEMLSIRQIGRLTKPLLWTLHDEWAMRGAEHIALLPDPERWRSGYQTGNRRPSDRGLDIDRWVWRRKRAAWRRPMVAVCPSQWLANRAASSQLLGDWRLEVIPNPIDTEVWRPKSQGEARARLGLAPDVPLVVFGAVGGTTDPNKGADLLMTGMEQLAARRIGPFRIGIFGQAAPSVFDRWPVPVTFFGVIARTEEMLDVYAAADVVVLPSRIENLPNVAVEAQCCARPVVAFSTGGLPECVVDGETGCLVPPFETGRLADRIAELLEEPERRRVLGEAGRRRAERVYSARVIAPRFAGLYQEILDARKRDDLGC